MVKTSWKNIGLDNFAATHPGSNLSGFLGLEECTDYDLNSLKEKPRKRKQELATITTLPNKKKKKNNGFLVETISPDVQMPTKGQRNTASDINRYRSETKSANKNPTDIEVNETIPAKSKKQKKTKKGKNKNKPVPKPVQKESVKQKVQKDDAEKFSLVDMAAWSSFQIPEEVLQGLYELGFTKPTQIQELTLHAAMLGRRDILGAAETGSGKTLAFGIPIISGIMQLKKKEQSGQHFHDIQYKKSSVKKNMKQETAEKKKGKFNQRRITNEEDDDQLKDLLPAEADSDNEGDIETFLQNSDDENSDFEEQNSDLDEQNSDLELDEPNSDLDELNSDLGEQNSDLDEQNSDSEDKNENEVQSDNSEDYVHLSELDLFEESENSENESDAADETQEGSDAEINVDDQGMGCVKVIDDIELSELEQVSRTDKPLYALVLTPTRELAMQVHKHLVAAAKYTGVRIGVLVGGMAHVKQERVLSQGPEIVVATPGRLWELIQAGNSHLKQIDSIKFLAIDETDRMTQRSHFEELGSLLERINTNDQLRTARQNFVFSATLTMVHDLPTHMKGKKVTKNGKVIYRKVEQMTPQQKLKKLISLLGITDPKVVDITSNNQGTARTLTEARISCAIHEKDYYLYYILKRHPGRAIVFCNSIGCVQRLTQLMGLLDCKALPLHAKMIQRQRLKNLDRFREDPYGVLVATDVAARGLDIPNVDHVIHYQVPRTAENYVHRSGRTARASKEGLTILMMEPGEARNYLKLCKTLGKSEDIPSFPVPDRYLLSIKELLTAAQELDRLELADRKQNQEAGWLKQAAEEMDIIVDEDDMPMKSHGSGLTSQELNNKRKHLKAIISKPLFPKGFSFKYPTLNNGLPNNVLEGTENALTVMKTALETKSGKKEKRASRNAHLLQLGKEVRGIPVNVTDIQVPSVSVKDGIDKVVNGQTKNGGGENKSKKHFKHQKKGKNKSNIK